MIKLEKLKCAPRCSKCGGQNMTLAKDRTSYSRCSFDEDEQKWVEEFSDTQDSDAEDSVRFFCADCGTRHEIPEELK